jgi:hypothetical protein
MDKFLIDHHVLLALVEKDNSFANIYFNAISKKVVDIKSLWLCNLSVSMFASDFESDPNILPVDKVTIRAILKQWVQAFKDEQRYLIFGELEAEAWSGIRNIKVKGEWIETEAAQLIGVAIEHDCKLFTKEDNFHIYEQIGIDYKDPRDGE